MPTTTYAAATLVKYRWLIFELVLRDLRLRYRGSVLGFAWTLLNPVLFMLIYTLVFSVYLRIAIPHFSLFLLSGLIPWTWLNTAVSMGTSAIVDGRMYVGKTLFPTEVLVVVPVASAAVNFILSLPILLVIAAVVHAHLGMSLIALPVVALIELIIVQGLVLLTATVNVFYRDLQQLIVYMLTVAFYVTPIFYTRSMVPLKYEFLITYNPLAPMITAYQDILYRGIFPNMYSLLTPLIVGIALLLLAHGVFARYRESFSQYV